MKFIFMKKIQDLTSIDTRYLIFGSIFSMSTKLETIGKDFLGELTTKQWFLLLNLATFFDEPPSISELSEQMGTSHQNVKQIALKLQEKRFLRIKRDEFDNRTSRLEITDMIERYNDDHRAANNEFIERLFDGINPDELKEFLSVTMRLLENLDTLRSR